MISYVNEKFWIKKFLLLTYIITEQEDLYILW